MACFADGCRFYMGVVISTVGYVVGLRKPAQVQVTERALREAPRFPPMLLQPLVENAIKHGLEPKVCASSIEVEAARVGSFIELRVNDSGLGLPADGNPASSTGTSYGLQHVRDRLRVSYAPFTELRLGRRTLAGVSTVIRIPG